MKRVAIVGSGGAGKSTFAAALGEVTGFPVFHLDRVFWQPGWVETHLDVVELTNRRTTERYLARVGAH